jgi:hypothetical protein
MWKPAAPVGTTISERTLVLGVDSTKRSLVLARYPSTPNERATGRGVMPMWKDDIGISDAQMRMRAHFRHAEESDSLDTPEPDASLARVSTAQRRRRRPSEQRRSRRRHGSRSAGV